MDILLNGKRVTTDARDLEALVDSLEHSPTGIATAVNGEFVPRGERGARTLNRDDEIDIVAPITGG